MHDSYAYKTEQHRTVQMRDPTEPIKNVHVSHCPSDSGLCAPMHFHSRGAHQVEVILQVNSDAWQARKPTRATLNTPQNKMRTAEPGAGNGGVEHKEPKAGL